MGDELVSSEQEPVIELDAEVAEQIAVIIEDYIRQIGFSDPDMIPHTTRYRAGEAAELLVEVVRALASAGR